MTDILETAHNLITGDRATTYGPPTKSMSSIADLWSAYLHQTITPEQVAMMMALLKIARTTAGSHDDNYIDAAAYIAIAHQSS